MRDLNLLGANVGIAEAAKQIYTWGAIACGVCTGVGGTVLYLNSYKQKLDAIDPAKIEERLAKLEKMTASGGSPEGPRAPQASQGKSREIGEQGERPTASTRQPGQPVQVASADAGTAPSMPTGLQKTANGCYFFTPDVTVVTGSFGVGDKFCTIDGKLGWTISSITDDNLRYGPSGKPDEKACYVGNYAGTCYLGWFNNRLSFKAKKITMDSGGKLSVELEFRMAN